LGIAIIQPGKIGDIIICLPIAHHFYRRRQEVIWPVHRSLVSMFEAAVDYVHFIPVDTYDLAGSMQAIAPYNPERILPLAFGFPGYERLTSLWVASGKPFDEYKYEAARVPFDRKNTLVLRRNPEREESLFRKLVKNDYNNVLITNPSDQSIQKETASSLAAGDRIHVTNETESVFDWLGILEKASAYFMIDSCMVNLASQMGFAAPGVRCWKPGYGSARDYPVLRDNWIDYRESATTGIARIR
jgi:hypothetical protein